MSNCNLIEETTEDFRKKFTVKIDLQNIDSKDLKALLKHLRDHNLSDGGYWLEKIADIIERK